MASSCGKVANRYNIGRPIPDILANPKHGETVPATALGKTVRNRYVWITCPNCGWSRWMVNKPTYRNLQHCRKCSRGFMDCRKYKPNSKNSLHRTIQPTAIPKIGDKIGGEDIGKRRHTVYVWLACPDCGKNPHWVALKSLNNGEGKLCLSCANNPKRKRNGEKSGAWKGGRRINHEGYVLVRILSDSPFYSMSQRGSIMEHRLVMARHLDRCLHSWEVVHHKHTRFPSGSPEDKQDNRIENLELIQVPLKHTTITLLEKKAIYLTEQIDVLKKEMRLQKWQIRELTEQVRVMSAILEKHGV